ncbi:unnamed protein product [Sphagnum jensenii]|uniref:Rhomboid protein n=1 Tax=Sphagnum jensenii TaxID=128206 RepID=A0ABP0VB02_9BRYO
MLLSVHVQGWGLFTGFTRLSKRLAVLLASWLSPHYLAPLICQISGIDSWKVYTNLGHSFFADYFLTPYVYGHQRLILSIAALLIVGRLLEPLWGSKEFLKFIIFVHFYASASIFVLAIFLYYVSRREDFLYVSVSGFHGVLAGFLVAVKQIMPDQEVSVLFKLHAKWLPSVLVALVLVTSLFLNQPMHYVPFIVFGTYGAYLQRKPEVGFKGNASSEFSLSTFFPEFLYPLVNAIATVFKEIFFGQRSQVLEGQGYELGNPLPGSDPVEASQ